MKDKEGFSDLQALVFGRTAMRVGTKYKDHGLYQAGRELERRALHARKQGKAWVSPRPKLKVVQ